MPSSSAGKVAGKRSPRDLFRPIASSLALPTAHVAAIDDSHDRCAALGLSRFESPDLSPISRSELSILRERNERLHAHAAPVMEMLFEQIEHTQSMVVLCDATGTVLHAVGDDDFLGRASKVALAPGANWSESSKGTNGIGTALISEQPTLVHADEHFVHANHFLTCSAAPILDPRGNVLGVLDVSGDHRSYHQHTMALVKMSARMIENHWLTDDYRHVMRLHFHGRADYLGTLKEGILAITAEGRIVGANRGALDLLGQSGVALRMQSVRSLFGVGVSELVQHFRSPLATPYRAHTGQGHAFYLLARFDWPVWHTIAEAAGNPTGATMAASTGTGDAPSGSADTVVASAKAPPSADDRQSAVGAGAAPRDRARPVTGGAAAGAGLDSLLTGDPTIALIVDKARRVLDRAIPIVLHGEVGSGKATLAHAIHNDSRRRDRPFVTVHCAAMPAQLTALELFGDERVPGKLRQADGGTLYLSEVAELSVEAQAQLLRVLLDGQFVPLGSRHPVAVNVAVLAGTRCDHRALRHLVTSGRMREDLYFRLAGLELRLPPLRDRTDLAALAGRIVHREALARPPSLAADVLDALRCHPWPGNVRQLANLLRTACVMAGDAATIERKHLAEDFLDECDEAAARSGALPVAASDSERPPAAPTGPRSLDDLELAAIEEAVNACHGNISQASKRLGISRNTIYRRLRWKDKPR